jgi:hypothetical protein
LSWHELGTSLKKQFNETIEGDRTGSGPERESLAMKFVLEVDMGDTAWEGNAARELGRILRYWGGNLQHYELKPGDGATVSDSDYREVGSWSITAST